MIYTVPDRIEFKGWRNGECQLSRRLLIRNSSDEPAPIRMVMPHSKLFSISGDAFSTAVVLPGDSLSLVLHFHPPSSSSQSLIYDSAMACSTLGVAMVSLWATAHADTEIPTSMSPNPQARPGDDELAFILDPLPPPEPATPVPQSPAASSHSQAAAIVLSSNSRPLSSHSNATHSRPNSSQSRSPSARSRPSSSHSGSGYLTAPPPAPRPNSSSNDAPLVLASASDYTWGGGALAPQQQPKPLAVQKATPTQEGRLGGYAVQERSAGGYAAQERNLGDCAVQALVAPSTQLGTGRDTGYAAAKQQNWYAAAKQQNGYAAAKQRKKVPVVPRHLQADQSDGEDDDYENHRYRCDSPDSLQSHDSFEDQFI